jgi:hypothetical protein
MPVVFSQSDRRIRETSIWRIAMSHQYPPARSASVNGSGSRAHQRWQNQLLVGAENSVTSCDVSIQRPE